MGGILHQRFDRAKCFLFDNRFDNGQSYTNSSGDEVTLAQWTVMGRVTSTGKLKVCLPDATDGSQVPRFILVEEYTVADGATQTVAVCKAGDVDQGLLVWGETTASPPDVYALTDTVYVYGDDTSSPPETASIPLGTVKDVLFSNGINCKSVSENSEGDNGTPDYNS